MKKHPLRRGVGLVQASSKEIQKNYTAAVSRTLHLTGLSGIGSILLALLKLLSGVLSLSVFTCVNGLYTLGMVLARYCALWWAWYGPRRSQSSTGTTAGPGWC